MISGLHQPYPGETAIACPAHHVLHQPFPDGGILQSRIDRDRADVNN